MIKIMLVDDDKFSMEYIKNLIPWNQYGCTICGYAHDGYEGIEMAKKLLPDLIITDVCMPKLNGIEMAQTIREFIPTCNFIIITGFDELSYAVGAVEVDAVDFIVKPIDEMELFTSVKRICTKINEYKKNRDLGKEQVLLNLMNGEVKSNVEENLKTYKISLRDFVIMYIELDYYEKILATENIMEADYRVKYINDLIYRYFEDNSFYVVRNSLYSIAIIFNMDGDKSEKDIEKLIKSIQYDFSDKFKDTVSCGISNVGGLEDIKFLYEQAKQALRHKVVIGKNTCQFFHNLQYESMVRLANLNTQEIKLIMDIKSGAEVEAIKQLKKMYSEVIRYKKINMDIVKNISFYIIFAIMEALKEMEVLKENNISLAPILEKEIAIVEKANDLNDLEMVYSAVLKIIATSVRYMKKDRRFLSDI